MLVKVRFGEVQKYVKVAETDEGFDSFDTFLQKVFQKLDLPLETELHLTDESGTEVDADVFEELLRAFNVAVRVTSEKSTVLLQPNLSHTSWESSMSDNSPASVFGDSVSSDSSDATVIVKTNGGRRTHAEQESAKQMVRDALQTKPGGQIIFDEYDKTKTLMDSTRRQSVNLLVADMVEIHGTTPPNSVRSKYALGIISLFPSLRNPYSPNGYAHFYDPQSGSGYLAWRIKTVQHNSAAQSRRSPTTTAHQDSTKRRREFLFSDKQLFGDQCHEAISFLKHSTDASAIKEKMRATFQYRQSLVQDQLCSSTVLDVFPRFLDIPGLIDQDFNIMFGEEVSGRFLAKWPTFFKPRILADCKNVTLNEHIEDLLSTQQDSSGSGWDSDLSSVLLLVHLLDPPSKGHKKSAKISSCQAVDRVVKNLGMGAIVETFLAGVEPGQPFLLCVGEKKSSIQRLYVIIDHKAIPCKAQTSLAAFSELFKAHFTFGINYHESLYNFYTFIQTTVFNIDVGSAKETPRVSQNIPKSLVKQHQRHLAYHWENFDFQRFEFGPVKKEMIDSLVGGEALSSVFNVNAYCEVSTTNWVKNYGTEYQTGMFVCTGTNVEIPVFRKVTNIIIHDEQTFILTCGVDTLYFDDHLNAYCIEEKADSFSVLPLKEIVYHRPFNKQFSNEMCEKAYIVPHCHIF